MLVEMSLPNISYADFWSDIDSSKQKRLHVMSSAFLTFSVRDSQERSSQFTYHEFPRVLHKMISRKSSLCKNECKLPFAAFKQVVQKKAYVSTSLIRLFSSDGHQ